MAGRAGRSGRSSKPLEQHARAGTLRPGRHASLASLPDVEPAGYGWRKEPLVVLEDVVGAGVDWLARTDEPMLAMLRKALELQRNAVVRGLIRDHVAVQAHVVSILSLLGSAQPRARLGLVTMVTLSKVGMLQA